MLPDFDRADRIGEFWSYPESRAFAELHPYKVPELLAIPVTGGLERYLGWINSETSLTIA